MIGASFGSCQAWYHPADGNRAVLLCSAHGFEELCSRSTMRLLAGKLADAGMPVLRFDYPGTANSMGGDDDPKLVEVWRQSIKEAASWLMKQDGIDEIVVIGLRLGALLAVLEMNEIEGLCGLCLLAPALNGRHYTREAAILAKIMEAAPSYADATAHNDAIDVCGFCISKEAQSDLKALSLASAAPKRAIPVLVLSQRGLKAAEVWRSWSASGCAVTEEPFTGFDELICDPTASKIPQAAIDQVAEWATQLAPLKAMGKRRALPSSLEAEDWSESAVTFGAQGSLAGIVCRPAKPDPNALPVVFVNSGMNYHIGWSRSAVRQARALATAGIASLRYDTPGAGDSIDMSDSNELPLYNETAENGLVAAIDWLLTQGYPAPLVLGSCSGAYAAFHVARKDPRIKKALIANLQCFEWTPAIGFVVDRWRETRRAEVTARRESAGAEFEGGSTTMLLNLTLSAAGHLRRAGRVLKRLLVSKVPARGLDGDNRILTWLTDMSARRCEVILVYARGDIGLSALEASTGPGAERALRLPGVSLHILENCDHSITPRQAQEEITKLVLQHAITGASEDRSKARMHCSSDAA